MLGLGIDITPVERIAALDRAYPERFRRKVLAPGEMPRTAESLAGLWAAKEAVSKALGTGFGEFGPRDIRIGYDAHGAPTVTLAGRAEQVAQARGIARLLVSISHAGGMAVACAAALQ
ncbi:MAG: Holo-(acyl-carrier-protein) synthase [Firmicutes bacterium]|nr:Holo-(acyl-carrier-protein) synthase [candidate division NPL-UPA2 bacterium]MBT9153574.1 Holo-(acyl-carrier-protein) synthase [candidate division NPL-UPA2 bacterium]MBT9155628.1 Holo-(acyl-carrier-protein) synthase [candidate division NPL-UPA2 bacterium]